MGKMIPRVSFFPTTHQNFFFVHHSQFGGTKGLAKDSTAAKAKQQNQSFDYKAAKETMEEHAPEEISNINESDDVPMESVELNTIDPTMVGDASSLMHGPEEQCEYLPGWGGGRNGTVAPMPEVHESDEEETNETRRLPQESKMISVSFSFPSGIVPVLLVVNQLVALFLLGCYGFIKD
eukprot:scaffold1140_cov157-Amphora_coffeaeformis.AAC.8